MNKKAGPRGYSALAISLDKSHNPGSLLFCPGFSSLTILTVLTCKFGLVAAQRGPCVSIPRPRITPKKAYSTLTLAPLPPTCTSPPSHHDFPPPPPHRVLLAENQVEMGCGVASARLACSDWPAQHSTAEQAAGSAAASPDTPPHSASE